MDRYFVELFYSICGCSSPSVHIVVLQLKFVTSQQDCECDYNTFQSYCRGIVHIVNIQTRIFKLNQCVVKRERGEVGHSVAANEEDVWRQLEVRSVSWMHQVYKELSQVVCCH